MVTCFLAWPRWDMINDHVFQAEAIGVRTCTFICPASGVEDDVSVRQVKEVCCVVGMFREVLMCSFSSTHFGAQGVLSPHLYQCVVCRLCGASTWMLYGLGPSPSSDSKL